MGVWMIGLVIIQFVLLLARGPHVGRKTWLGWQGGMGHRKNKPEAPESRNAGELDAEKGVVEVTDDKRELNVDETEVVTMYP